MGVSVYEVYSICSASLTFLADGVLGGVGAAMSAWFFPCVEKILWRKLAKAKLVLGGAVAR
jgi:hypothetical protein